MKISSSLRRQAQIIARGLDRVSAALGMRTARRSAGGHARARLSGGEEGTAIVEIALTVPVLLGVLTGIVTFGIAYSNQLTLTQAVGSAGQYLSQLRAMKSTDPCADVFATLKNAAPGLNSTNISMTITLNGTPYAAKTCSGAQTNLVLGTPVTVYATYPCGLAIYGVTFAGSCSLAGKVTEYEY